MNIKRTIHTSHPDSLGVLQVLAKLGGITDFTIVTTEKSSEEVDISVEVQSQSPFSTSTRMAKIDGFEDCVLYFSKLSPEIGLWSKGCETWIKTSSSYLVNVAYVMDEEKAKETSGAVKSFMDAVETQLSSTTHLVGNSVTCADIASSILLATAARKAQISLDSLPPKTSALLQSILSNELVKSIVGDLLLTTTTDDEISAPTASLSLSDETSTYSENPIIAKLSTTSLPFTTYSHVLCTTAEDLVANVPVPPNHSHTKNLFFKDKKHGMFLVTCKPDAHINTKQLGKDLKLEGKTNLRFADEKVLLETLDCKPGCVGPLAIMKDLQEKQVTMVLDEGLMEMEKIHSHPLRNDVSVIMSPKDVVSFVEEVCEHPPVMLSFPSKEEADAAAPKHDSAKPAAAKKGGKKPPSENNKKVDKKGGKKGETLLAMKWKKEENFAMWYSDVIILSEMISYYDISGCYILRPWSYRIWELMQNWFNDEILKLGVENSYFPLFVSQDRLEKEKDHVEGFAPEVAWVTKSGDGTLAKPIAVRPTSETIMYPAFSDWIQSHRDLPLKLNQWSNVVRWEFKDPTPFLRSREFLWQEGHTAHATFDEANEMVMQALNLYKGVYEDLLAVPVVPGYKTEKEKFAGGYRTTTVEAYIAGSGRAIQGATSHHLGQNFGKMFDITFQNDKGQSETVWQTSWGLTTRTIGVMVMVHGDDVGLVLPPKIAPLQVVIVPIISKKLTSEQCDPYCMKILESLQKVGIRAKYDDRTMYNPGWKYNHWEQKGVPLRIEVGPRDLEQNQARVVTRHNNLKEDFSVEDLATLLPQKLESIQNEMFIKAKTARDQHLVQVTDWKDFVPNLEKNNLVLTPWCGGEYQEWEEVVKEKSREESLKARGEGEEDARCAVSVAAKTLCIPFDQPELPEGTMCLISGLKATCWVLWGRSY